MGQVVTAVEKYKAGKMTLEQLANFLRTFQFTPGVGAGRSMLDPQAYQDVENDAFLGPATDSGTELMSMRDTGVLSDREMNVLLQAIREGHPRKP